MVSLRFRALIAPLFGSFQAFQTFDEIKFAFYGFEQAKADELPSLHLTYCLLSTFSQPDVGGLKIAHNVVANFHYIHREKQDAS